MKKDKHVPLDFSDEELRKEPQSYRHVKPYTDFRYGIEKYSENTLKGEIYRHPGLGVFNMKVKGYGVKTSKAIEKGEIVEECIVAYETIEPGWEYLDGSMHARNQNILASYRFAGPQNSNDNTQGKHAQCWVIAFGNAAIFNHSDDPNLIWFHVPAQRLIVFMALKDIKAGEELCHCYTSSTLSAEETQELVLNKFYNRQYMRQDVIKDKVRSAPSEQESPKDSDNMISGDINDEGGRIIEKEKMVLPVPIIPSSTFKKYIKEEIAAPKKLDTKAVDEVLSKEVNANWQPPNKGSNVTSKQFLDSYVPKKPSFEVEKTEEYKFKKK